MVESVSAATDLDLISYLMSIPDARKRRGVPCTARYLLPVAALGMFIGCHSLLAGSERFAIPRHAVLTEALGIELRRPLSDSSFRYFFHHVDVAAMCAAIYGWMIAKIPGDAEDLDQLMCDGKTLRGLIDHTAGGEALISAGSVFGVHVMRG